MTADRHEHGCEHELDAGSDSSLIVASGLSCSEIEIEYDHVNVRGSVDELCWRTNNRYWELEMVAVDNR